MKFWKDHWVPWYVFLRRLCMWPFVHLFRVLLFLAVLIGWGVDYAKDMWKWTS